jgi:xanthine/uracil permease
LLLLSANIGLLRFTKDQPRRTLEFAAFIAILFGIEAKDSTFPLRNK